MQNTIHSLVEEVLLKNNCTDVTIKVENISHQHAGHFKGNGNTHFVVEVLSIELKTLKPIIRHRLLNSSVAHLVKEEHIHAISFKVK